jgi:hypothetical protein
MNDYFFHAVVVQINEYGDVSNCAIIFDVLIFQVLPENRFETYVTRRMIRVMGLTLTRERAQQSGKQDNHDEV